MINKDLITIIISMAFLSCSGEGRSSTNIDLLRESKESLEMQDFDSLGKSSSFDSINHSSTNNCILFLLAIEQIKEEENIKEVAVVEEFIPWNIDWELDFNVKKYKHPKTNIERKKRVESPDPADPYPLMYVYAPFIADSIFNKEDRYYMKDQAKQPMAEIECKFDHIRFVEKNSKERKKIAFLPPLYSKDHQFAVVRAIVYFETNGKEKYTGFIRTYFYRSQIRGWDKIYIAPKWQ